ncbi:MAG: hypothetical protein J6B44_06230 [Muribaculaceae bacterium]|nr:hypothetical protein [Muribaculaceae bacterium]
MRVCHKISVLIAASLVAVAAVSSCNTNGCTENRNAVPLAAFFDSANEEKIQLDSLDISGVDAPNDTVLSAAGERISQVYLPMRPTHQSVKWCIAYKWRELDDPSLNDTLTLVYTSRPYFASEECGVYYRYSITDMECTDHLIDWVEIVDSVITNIDKVYLNIYFRVQSEEK